MSLPDSEANFPCAGELDAYLLAGSWSENHGVCHVSVWCSCHVALCLGSLLKTNPSLYCSSGWVFMQLFTACFTSARTYDVFFEPRPGLNLSPN